MPDDLVFQARAALDAGRVDEARSLVQRALKEDPDNPEVRRTYVDLELARAVQLSARAREARRQNIVRRAIPYETEFDDPSDVMSAFAEALSAIDGVLTLDPLHEKALMMKASLIFRRDRKTGRPLALEILHEISTSNPANRQVAYAIRRIEAPCPRCGDSGFCLRCRGRGSRRKLGIESRCEACHGQGICLACGIL